MKNFKSSIYTLLLAGITLSCGNQAAEDAEEQTQETAAVDFETAEMSEAPIDETDPETEPIESREGNIAAFANAVIHDDISTVANFIEYPLKRQSPLPAILNVEEFEIYYPTLFDATLKEKLQSHLDSADIIDRSSSNGTIGILNGFIWFNDASNKVIAINYQSAEETEKIAVIDQKVRNTMHPILKDFEFNLFLGRTDEGLFRIDDTEKGLRYASWYGDQTLLDEPDFILWGGVHERLGTGGGWRTTFDRVDTKYIFDDVQMCQDPEDCGLFLVVEDEGEITSKLTVTEVLNPLDELVRREEVDESY